VENEDERKKLESLGIKASIVPTFLEDINEFPISYKASKPFKIWMSMRKGQENEYGLEELKNLSNWYPNIEFHIYGTNLGLNRKNVIEHGSVTNEKFNEEIKEYHCGLRTNESDGFSEVLAKAIFLGQYPITKIPYHLVASYKDYYDLCKQIEWVMEQKVPNTSAREHYIKKFNQFPFLNG
jgi:hypothetical protein